MDLQWLSWGKALVQFFDLQAKLAALLENRKPFLLERANDVLTDNSDLNIWQICYQKWIKCASHCKENGWEYLLPMIKLEISSKNSNSWKLASATMRQYLDFSTEVGGVFNGSDLLDIVKWSVTTDLY